MENHIAEKLQQLARLPDTRSPFITLYLDTKWTDPGKKNQAQIFLKNKISEAQGQVIQQATEVQNQSLERKSNTIDVMA